MLNFDNIEDLVAHMFEKLGADELVSVVADKDLSLSIVKELLDYNDVILKYANIDDYEYYEEYIVTLSDDDSDSWNVSIEPIYNYEKEMYFGTDGYVLFHEDVNSKALVDMQNNENIELSGYDWFVLGEEGEESEMDRTYTVNGESVDKKTFDEYVSKFAPGLVDKKSDTLSNDDYSISVKCNLDADEVLKFIKDTEHRMIHMNDMLREMDCFRRLFNW